MVKGRERTQKFYFTNEKEVMEDLGLRPTKGSGSSWIEKEDGSNDYILCQLKSTDKASYSLKKLDLEKLEYNAMVEKKVPMFLLQFLKDNSKYVLCNIDDIPKLAEYLKFGEIADDGMEIMDIQETKPKRKKKVKSSQSSRDAFYKEKAKEWEEKKWNQ